MAHGYRGIRKVLVAFVIELLSNHAAGIIIATVCSIDRLTFLNNSKTLSREAVSDGESLSQTGIRLFISSARIKFRVFLWPASNFYFHERYLFRHCGSILYGCANFHDPNVFVENLSAPNQGTLKFYCRSG